MIGSPRRNQTCARHDVSFGAGASKECTDLIARSENDDIYEDRENNLRSLCRSSTSPAISSLRLRDSETRRLKTS